MILCAPPPRSLPLKASPTLSAIVPLPRDEAQADQLHSAHLVWANRRAAFRARRCVRSSRGGCKTCWASPWGGEVELPGPGSGKLAPLASGLLRTMRHRR
jgi:hypothetical protein